MKCVIRIRGLVGVNRDVAETFNRLNLRKKYSCVLVDDSKEKKGMLQKLRNHVAMGDIDRASIEKLIENRGKSLDRDKKIDVKKVAEELEKGKSMKEVGLKPVFRLHPPRKGANTLLHYPKGILGDNKKDIIKLLERML